MPTLIVVAEGKTVATERIERKRRLSFGDGIRQTMFINRIEKLFDPLDFANGGYRLIEERVKADYLTKGPENKDYESSELNQLRHFSWRNHREDKNQSGKDNQEGSSRQ